MGQRRSYRGRNRHRPARLAVDEDVDEMAGGGGLFLAAAEEADLIAHAGVAEPTDSESRVDHAGKLEGAVEAALALHRDADHRTLVDVEPARLDQVLVDDRVEVRVVDHVVHVAVDVVVHPSRGDFEKARIIRAPLLVAFGHAPSPQSTVLRAASVATGSSIIIM